MSESDMTMEELLQAMDAHQEAYHRELRRVQHIIAQWDERDKQERGEDGFDG